MDLFTHGSTVLWGLGSMNCPDSSPEQSQPMPRNSAKKVHRDSSDSPLTILHTVNKTLFLCNTAVQYLGREGVGMQTAESGELENE